MIYPQDSLDARKSGNGAVTDRRAIPPRAEPRGFPRNWMKKTLEGCSWQRGSNSCWNINIAPVNFELPQVIGWTKLCRCVGKSADGLGVLADVERRDGCCWGGSGRPRDGQQVAFLLSGGGAFREHGGPDRSGIGRFLVGHAGGEQRTTGTGAHVAGGIGCRDPADAGLEVLFAIMTIFGQNRPD